MAYAKAKVISITKEGKKVYRKHFQYKGQQINYLMKMTYHNPNPDMYSDVWAYTDVNEGYVIDYIYA